MFLYLIFSLIKIIFSWIIPKVFASCAASSASATAAASSAASSAAPAPSFNSKMAFIVSDISTSDISGEGIFNSSKDSLISIILSIWNFIIFLSLSSDKGVE